MYLKRHDRRIRDALLSAALTLGVVWFGYLAWNLLSKEERARHAALDAQAALASLEERRTTLEGDVAELETERGREAVFRGTLGVARPGEEVIIVVPEATTTPPPSSPWWRRALLWLGF